MLTTVGLGVWGATTAASAAAIPAPTATISAPQSVVLAGEDLTLTVAATNSSASANGYNTSFAISMPNGISFVSSGGMGSPIVYPSGAQLPNSAKTPPLSTVPAGSQLWVFMDAADLPAKATYSSTVTVRPDASVFPVGAAPRFDLSAFVSSDPKLLPMFDGSTGIGGQAALADTSSATSSTTTPLSALRLSKSEPAPRRARPGRARSPTTYTLTVENTPEGATNGVTIVDYLAAGLEFLGCGRSRTRRTPRSFTPPPAAPAATANTPARVRSVRRATRATA